MGEFRFRGIEQCGFTGKQRFATKEAAGAALVHHARSKGCKKVHFCIFCDGYHTTKDARGKPGKKKGGRR